MRNSTLLNSLLPKTRQAILSATLLNPERWWYLSDMAEHLHVTPSTLQRELTSLVDAGILQSRRDRHRVYYQPNPQCPILPELRSLLVKTIGIADLLKEVLEPFAAKIGIAFVYGSIARQEAESGSDIDLMIVGSVGLSELALPFREAEKRLLRPVNSTIYACEEFARNVASGHHFVTTILNAPKIYLQGSEDELAAIINRQESENARHQFARTG